MKEPAIRATLHNLREIKNYNSRTLPSPKDVDVAIQVFERYLETLDILRRA